MMHKWFINGSLLWLIKHNLETSKLITEADLTQNHNNVVHIKHWFSENT